MRQITRSAAEETLERSIQMAPVQRRGLAAILAALVLSVGSIGWPALLPLSVSFVLFLVIKAQPVQRRLGVWSLGAVWAVGELGAIGAILLSRGPAEYMVSLLAIPTILGSVVWPRRWVQIAAFLTAGLMLGSGALANPTHFVDNLAGFCIPAGIAVAASLMTLVARDAEASMRADSQVDALTGVRNRTALADARTRITARGPAARGALAFIVADVDAFKVVNDRFGHEGGDAVLARVAGVLTTTAGDIGSVYRYGGEEFVVVVEGPAAQEAVALAERLRVAVERADERIPVTLSLGVAAFAAHEPGSFDDLFARADARLYLAKRLGRNRVVSSGGAPPAPAVQSPAIAQRSGDGADAAARGQEPPFVGTSIRTTLERMHLVNMTERQHRSNPGAYILIGGLLLLFNSAVGWWSFVAGVGGGVFFRLAQRVAIRRRRPELVLAGAWVLAQAATALGVIVTTVPALWALPVLAAMMVANSATFSARFTVIGAIYSGLLAIGSALVIDPTVFTTAPEAVTIALAMMMTAAITGRAVGRLAVNMRAIGAHDALTGLPNRAACADTAAALMGHAGERREPFAVIVGDLDHFKGVNDSFGHSQGDAVLVALVARLSAEMRQDAMLFRLGGEEFGILVAGINAARAGRMAERLRAAVASRPLAGSPVTISFGVAVAGPDDADYQRVLRRADEALYRAKRAGRNRVIVDEVASGGADAAVGTTAVTPSPVSRA